MKRTITLFSLGFQLLSRKFSLAFMALAAFALLPSSSIAQSPYCNAAHTATGCPTYNMYIGKIKITQGSDVVFDKSDDQCNNTASPNYSFVAPSSAFTLAGGGEYTFAASTGNNYQVYIGVWIDLNGDNDFTDTDEYIKSMLVSTGGGTTSFNFTVPCTNLKAGTTRMRVRSQYSGSGNWNAGMSCTSVLYGETEDYTIDLGLPSSLTSDFFLPDTAYVGTLVKMTNSSTGNTENVWDIGVNGTIDYTTENAVHIFSSTGTYCVKLRNTNCLGSDSTTKCITIVNPTAPPVADFVATKNVVELFDVTQLVDLSTNGATYWNWFLTNGTDTIDGVTMSSLQGGDPYTNKDPLVYTGSNPVGFPKIFPDRGLWTVCLQSSNSIGSSAVKCKTDYIEVTKTSFNMGPETSLPANIISAERGTLYDKGGPNNNYTVPEANLEALIAPCGAQSVTIDFVQFKLLANANLKIYDGVNALGTPLHPGTGFTAGMAPTGPITANTGTLYLLWNSSAGATDSGFIANWTSVAGSGIAPVANFDLPGDTIYNAVFVDFINTSTDAEGNVDFEWKIDGSSAGFNRDLNNQIFLTNGSHTISLKVINCDGTTSTATKTIWVAHPGTPTELDFIADNRRPGAGETVTFTATSDKANQWEWTFFPSVGVNTVGSTSNGLKERQFQFTQPGKYTVQCNAYNVIDSTSSENSVIKAQYIIVVEHCIPVISVTTSTDIGISNVRVEEDATGEVLINNASTTGVGYEDFTGDATIEINFGGTYNFEVARLTNTNQMTRKIWIDWNVDGDFDDAGEEVASQSSGTSMKWAGSFTAPNAANAFEANTRMRVGTSYGTDPNEPCGANSGVPNANRIGEFEDYSVRIVNDGDNPTITLNGGDTVYVEQGKIYTDLGATAWDPSQGNITGDIVITTNVNTNLTGIYSVTYCVEDASGNPAPCVTRTVYVVVDQTPPVITLNGSANETIEVKSVWTDAGATAMDNKDGNLDGAIVVTGSVDANTLGVYTITYTVQDAQGNQSVKVRTITVVDTEAPVITNASAYPAGASYPGQWVVDVQLQNVFVDVTSFTDNYNSIGNNLTVTASPGLGFEASVDTRFKGTTVVTYEATDESGNSTSQVIRYIVEDYIPPMIDLHTLDTVYHDVNTPYSPVDATVSDNLYNSTQISLTKTSNVNPYKLGTYQDTYTATDASGNVNTRLRYVKVVDRKAPVISGKNGPIVRVGLYSTFAAIERVVFSDNYDSPADLKSNAVLLYTDINTYVEGLYTATFQTTDNSGNLSDPFTLYVQVSRSELKVGVEELDLSDLMSVSPNPTTGLFTINVDLPENEEISIDIYNSMGQKVTEVVSANISQGSYSVNLSNNANGFYYVRMQVRGTVLTKKVILNQ